MFLPPSHHFLTSFTHQWTQLPFYSPLSNTWQMKFKYINISLDGVDLWNHFSFTYQIQNELLWDIGSLGYLVHLLHCHLWSFHTYHPLGSYKCLVFQTVLWILDPPTSLPTSSGRSLNKAENSGFMMKFSLLLRCLALVLASYNKRDSALHLWHNSSNKVIDIGDDLKTSHSVSFCSSSIDMWPCLPLILLLYANAQCEYQLSPFPLREQRHRNISYHRQRSQGVESWTKINIEMRPFLLVDNSFVNLLGRFPKCSGKAIEPPSWIWWSPVLLGVKGRTRIAT